MSTPTPRGNGAAPQPDEVVHARVDDRVAILTLDSPANRNALSRRLVGELTEHLRRAEADPDVVAVLLDHTGGTFCSGADLNEAAGGGMAASGGRSGGSADLVALMRRLLTLDKPVVVRVDGKARAGGLGLLGAADVVVASAESSFAFTEVRLALAPAAISLPLLPRLDARGASRYFLTGETFSGAEAARIGLVSTVAEDVDGALEPVLDGLRAGAAQGLREAKRLLNAAPLAEFDARAAEMTELSARLFGSDAARAAMESFLEARRARRRPGES